MWRVSWSLRVLWVDELCLIVDILWWDLYETQINGLDVMGRSLGAQIKCSHRSEQQALNQLHEPQETGQRNVEPSQSIYIDYEIKSSLINRDNITKRFNINCQFF